MKTKPQLIAFVGGPGSGKSTVLQALQLSGYQCFDEFSRSVTNQAQSEGIDHLWHADPLKFSEILLEGRKKQHQNALKAASSFVFLDRGIPDILAYLDMEGNRYGKNFEQACLEFRYDKIFFFPPWESIYTKDNERYETFAQAQQISVALAETYKHFGYELISVPFGSIIERMAFIIQNS